MNSLDFLTPREVIEDCVRQAALPSLGAAMVGCVAWGVLAVLGKDDAEEPIFALVVPFLLSAIYGNMVIYNVRWKHGVRVMRGHWWSRLTVLSIAWSVAFTALGLATELALSAAGIVGRQRSLAEALEFLLIVAAFSFAFSLLPAKHQHIN